MRWGLQQGVALLPKSCKAERQRENLEVSGQLFPGLSALYPGVALLSFPRGLGCDGEAGQKCGEAEHHGGLVEGA